MAAMVLFASHPPRAAPFSTCLSLTFTIAGILLLLTASTWILNLPFAAHLPSSRPSLRHHGQKHGRHGAVASESDICSRVGIDFLRRGGNAADAHIGTTICLGVVAMYHVGIGGGGFMLVRGRDGVFETIDYKEVAPAAAFEEMFVDNVNASLYGGLASGVPGELRGLEYLHQKYASLPWVELLQPAIKLAREGFIINDDLSGYMHRDGFDFLREDPAWAVDFAPNGTLKAKGDLLVRPRLANTLEKISIEGVDAFYNGDIAAATINAIQQANGTMTLEDLHNYQAHSRVPMQISYRDYVLTSNDVPGGGPQALSAMKTVEGYDMTSSSDAALNLSTHRLVEAIRFSWGERVALGDPAFNNSIYPYAHRMVAEPAAEYRRNKISDLHTLDPEAYNPFHLSNAKTFGTTSVSSTDEDGLTISWTSTINGFWGSRICVPETGFILNNIMNDFANPQGSDIFGVPPSPQNYPQPGKKPMGSVFNVMAEHASNRTFIFATGTAGGSHIITTGIQMLWFVLDRGMSANQAINQPRLHDQLSPNILEFDWTYDNRTAAYMSGLGHNITFSKPGESINNAVLRRWDGLFEAATEPAIVNGGAYTT